MSNIIDITTPSSIIAATIKASVSPMLHIPSHTLIGPAVLLASIAFFDRLRVMVLPKFFVVQAIDTRTAL